MHAARMETTVGPGAETGPAAGPLRVAGATVGAASFDDLYRSEWPGIVALAWSLTGSWAVAEELAQDGFGDAYRRWAEVGRLDRPGAWVRRAVINRSADQHRRRATERTGLARAGSLQIVSARAGASAADPTGDEAVDRAGDPAFWAAVRALPERQAACVALHYLEDRSVDDIAGVLGCRPATVKVHLHRGRAALARALGPGRRTNDESQEVAP